MTRQRLTVLGVFAHPADMVTETGGTFALHAQAGDDVVIVVLTHGGRIHPNLYLEEQRKEKAADAEVARASRERVIGIKHAEAEAAARILGIRRVEYLDQEDVMIGAREELVRRVADVMTETRPQLLVTHHPGFGAAFGSDHCLTGQIAVAAAFASAHRLSNLGDKSPHSIRQAFYVGSGISSSDALVPGGGYHNDLYIDITPVVELKVRALDQFVSQGYDGEYARKCVSGHNGHWGSIAGATFAEPFVRSHAETHALLPIAEANLSRDPLTLHRAYSRQANLWQIPREASPTDRYLKEKP